MSGRFLHGFPTLPYHHRGGVINRGGHNPGQESDPTAHRLLDYTYAAPYAKTLGLLVAVDQLYHMPPTIVPSLSLSTSLPG